jgi:hypothetical protein
MCICQIYWLFFVVLVCIYISIIDYVIDQSQPEDLIGTFGPIDPLKSAATDRLHLRLAAAAFIELELLVKILITSSHYCVVSCLHC